MLQLGTACGINPERGTVRISRYDPDPDKNEWGWSKGNGIYLAVYKHNGKWYVKVIPVRNGVSKDASVKLLKIKTKNGIPYEFEAEVTVNRVKRIITYRETDRFDINGLLKEDTQYALFGGYKNTYTIGLLGAVGSGKSSFWHSLRYQKNFTRLTSYFSGEFRCVPAESPIPRLGGNVLGTFDGTPIQYSASNGRHEVDIVVFDMGGEITKAFFQGPFAQEKFVFEDALAADDVIRSAKQLDCLFLFVKGRSLFKEHDEVIGNYRNALDKLQTMTEKAIVITEADVIQERLAAGEQHPGSARNELINDAVLKSTSPVFRQCSSREDMRRHIALAGSIQGDLFAPTKVPCFMISTLNEGKDREGSDILDFSKAVNAELPLVWILSHMKHITMKEE